MYYEAGPKFFYNPIFCIFTPMNQVIKSVIVLLVFFYLPLSGQIRIKHLINDDWYFFQTKEMISPNIIFSVTTAQPVSLPHTWNAEDAFDEVPGYFRGNGWYRKKILIPLSFKHRKIFIYFEGANEVTDVYINNKHAGTHRGGYTGFCFDITGYVVPGDTAWLAIRVNNENHEDIPPISGDWTFYGGIYRDVFLIATHPLHFNMLDHGSEGVFFSTPLVNEKYSHWMVNGTVVNENNISRTVKISMALLDKSEKKVSSADTIFTAATGISKFLLHSVLIAPKLWSPANPYLYTLLASVSLNDTVTDILNIPVGIRSFSVDTVNGFVLNGIPVQLNGVCRTQDYSGLGFALCDEQHRDDARLIKELGAVFVRAGHYPMDKSFVDELDRLGILYWEEIPVSDVIDTSVAFMETCKYNLTEMIRQHYNHPSIILWGYYNEIMLTRWRGISAENLPLIEQKTLLLAHELEKITRTEDSLRITANANHNKPEWYNNLGLNDISVVTGWNIYNGWYSKQLDDFGKEQDHEHQRYPHRLVIISEYGAGSDRRINTTVAEPYDFSIQYQQLFHENYWQQINRRKYIIGSTIWNLTDFGSEQRNESMPAINNKGLLTFDREKKDVYFFYKAAWSPSPVLHIATNDWNHRVGFAINDSLPVISSPLKIYSNCDSIVLWINDRLSERKMITNFNAVFDIFLSNGINTLMAIGWYNGQTVTTQSEISCEVLERDLKKMKRIAIGINAGSNCSFTDHTGFTWMPDMSYFPGGCGYTGGHFFRSKNNRPGIQNNILGTNDDPLYQTCRDSVTGYRFDVPDGEYRIDLLFTEPEKQFNTKLLYDISAEEEIKKNITERIFSISINNEYMITDLDIARDYGIHHALDFSFTLRVKNSRGIDIRFIPVKGRPIVSGIKIVQLR